MWLLTKTKSLSCCVRTHAGGCVNFLLKVPSGLGWLGCHGWWKHKEGKLNASCVNVVNVQCLCEFEVAWFYCTGFHQGQVGLAETDVDQLRRKIQCCLSHCSALEVEWFYHAAFHQDSSLSFNSLDLCWVKSDPWPPWALSTWHVGSHKGHGIPHRALYSTFQNRATGCPLPTGHINPLSKTCPPVIPSSRHCRC